MNAELYSDSGYGEPSPLVSVVTPSLNPPLDLLRRCIESVANQSYPHLEHVVIDGGSNNGCLDLLSSYPDVRFISESDFGQSDALNKGFFDVSDGDFLVWLNSDDVLLPGVIQRIVDILVSKSDIGWVYGNIEVVANGKRSVTRPPTQPSLDALDFENSCLVGPGSAFRRSALERVGALDTGFSLLMDFDLALRLIKEGIRGFYLPTSLALFELYPGTKSAEASKRQVMEEQHRIYLKHGMLLQAGAALALAGRYDVSDRITSAVNEKDFAAAQSIAAEGLRFMPRITERHRISFWITRLFPRLTWLFKKWNHGLPNG